MSALNWLLDLLVCPACMKSMEFVPDLEPGSGLLRHRAGCDEVYPVIGGIPRLLRSAQRGVLLELHSEWFLRTALRRELAQRWFRGSGTDIVVRGFDYEWSRFRQVGTAELGEVFGAYFDVVPRDLFAKELTVLDAGCGGGRWAAEVASRGPRVVAVDLGLSIEVARENCDPERVACVQADLLDLCFAPGAFDWGYSLGVLHHTADPNVALRQLNDAIRPGGFLLLYLYYALDNRGPAFRVLFKAVDLVRRFTSKQPRPIVLALSSVAAVLVYWPLARLAHWLDLLGATRLAARLPLGAYRDRSLLVMRNDSLDRFGTEVELRFTRQEMNDMLVGAGFDEVRFSEDGPYWHAMSRVAMQRS